jgi:vacuolar-type H+-ATPase subunit H
MSALAPTPGARYSSTPVTVWARGSGCRSAPDCDLSDDLNCCRYPSQYQPGGGIRHARKRWRKADGAMQEASPTERILKRLIEAENQAEQIVKAAEERAKETVEQARQQARQSLETVRKQAESSLRSRLDEAESKAAAEMKRRLDQAEAEAREIDRRAKQHFSEAVEMVVEWVTNRGD